MSLSWELGTFEIAIGRSFGETAEQAAARWERGDADTETVDGLVSGPFGVHRGRFGFWTLSVLPCGFRIVDSTSVLAILRFAADLAGLDLDWSGSPTEAGRRNSAAMRAAMKGKDVHA